MQRMPRVLASTTSHKKEPLLPTLEVFGRLGLVALDLNLHHLIEVGVPVETVERALAEQGQRVWVVSGGWCDFFNGPPEIERTVHSVARQVDLAQRLGASRLRLFFGRLKRSDYSPAVQDVICDNLRRLSDHYLDMTFVFENHDGASLDPAICAEIFGRVDRPNVRMNFDPINFERAGVDSLAALDAVQPFVGHVHLKGLEAGEYCEFGTGDVDLRPVLERLLDAGYTGQFTVEYEGPFDGTLRLHQSVRRADATLAAVEERREERCHL